MLERESFVLNCAALSSRLGLTSLENGFSVECNTLGRVSSGDDSVLDYSDAFPCRRHGLLSKKASCVNFLGYTGERSACLVIGQ